MAAEPNVMVEAAIRRSLSRRELGPAAESEHAGLFHEEFDKLKTRHGPDAADAARELADRFMALHLRAAVHDVRNIISVDLPQLGSFSVARLEIVIAFTNLIKNAIEAHGREENLVLPGRVEISGGVLDGFIQIQVRDYGNGLSQACLEDLLRFIPGKTSKRGGSGYGLPLCNRYVTAHGGRLTLESQEDEGTTATVFLPVSDPSETSS